MKQVFILILFVSTLGSLWAQALLGNYTFEYLEQSYTQLSSGTALGNVNSDEQYFTNPALLNGGNQSQGPGFPIGFDFDFAGSTYDVVGVHVNGWISLGKSSLGNSAVDMRSTSLSTPISTTLGGQSDPALVARIAACGTNLKAQEGSAILLAVSGTAPNRVLTVEWKNYRRGSNESLNFQIKLIETDMSVAVVFGTMTASSSAALQVGLRSAPATETTNYANRLIPNGTAWAQSQTGTAINSSAVISTTQYPVSGATFKWIPPVALIADFSADVRTGTAPLSIQFTDLSVAGGNPITGWSWSIGTQTSTLQNPLFSISNPGVYDVSLTVSDGTNQATVTKIGYITVLSADIPGVNTSIQMDGNDALVSWAPTLMDGGLSPDYYFLYFNGSNDPGGEFYFLAPIAYPATQYRHVGVGLGASHMFYRVTAVRID